MTAGLANLFIKFSESDVFTTLIFNQLSNVLRDRTREDLVFHCRSLNGILSSFLPSQGLIFSNDLVFRVHLAYLLSISFSFDNFSPMLPQ